MNKLIKSLEKGQIVVGIICLLIFFMSTIVQIVTRFFGWSVLWTEELANYSFIWAIFMGAAVMVNHKEHFTFDLLQAKLKGKPKLYLSIFIDALLVIFNIFITLYGFQLLNHFWNFTWETVPAFNMGVVWLAVPVMSITMLVYSSNHILNSFISFKDQNEKELRN